MFLKGMIFTLPKPCNKCSSFSLAVAITLLVIGTN